MSRFGNQWKNDVMNRVTKILILTFCAVLALSSCRKNRHTPELDNRPVSLNFRALSQDNAMKAGTKATPLADKYNDFGVWGIARHDGQSPYILWSSDAMTPVNKTVETVNNVEMTYFVPYSDAFWIRDYRYHFLAIAPYTDLDASVTATASEDTPAEDALNFTYDMGAKYSDSDSDSDYEFDLLGASAASVVNESHARGAQDLTFWHLLTKLTIEVSFVNEDGTSRPGTVSRMQLCNIDSKAAYTISFESDSESDSDALRVGCTSDASESQVNLTFNNVSTQTLNIVPQKIDDVELYLDFSVTENGQPASTTNFKVNLGAAIEGQPDAGYGYNEVYKWTITISPKIIKFTVSVTPWADYTDTNGDLNFDIQ